MTVAKEAFTVAIPPELVGRIRAAAAERDLAAGWLASRLLHEALAERGFGLVELLTESLDRLRPVAEFTLIRPRS